MTHDKIVCFFSILSSLLCYQSIFFGVLIFLFQHLHSRPGSPKMRASSTRDTDRFAHVYTLAARLAELALAAIVGRDAAHPAIAGAARW